METSLKEKKNGLEGPIFRFITEDKRKKNVKPLSLKHQRLSSEIEG